MNALSDMTETCSTVSYRAGKVQAGAGKKRVFFSFVKFHFRRAAFDSQLKSRVGLALAKAEALRINLKIDGVTFTSPLYERSVDSSVLVFSLQVHRTDTHI